MGLALSLGRDVRGVSLRIPESVRREHLHVLGVSGTGKSTFLLRQIQADILSGKGVTLCDPHGSLATALMSWLYRMDCDGTHFKGHPIYLIEPSNRDVVTGFNLLEQKASEDTQPVDQLMSIISEAWGGEDTNVAPTLTNVLFAVLYYLRVNNLTLAEAPTLLRRMREFPADSFLASIDNLEIRDRFTSLLSLPHKDFEATILSTINRLDKLLSTPVVKRMLGLRGKSFSFAKAFSERAITIINLAENATGRSEGAAIGDRSIDVLGAFFLNALKHAATQRPVSDWDDTHYLYVDECSRFLGKDAEYFLTGTRKFGLAVTLAHQNISQIKEKSSALEGAVRNMRNFISFALPDPDDCRWAADKTLLGETFFNQGIPGSERPVQMGVERIIETTRSISESTGTSKTYGENWQSGSSWSRSSGVSVNRGTSVSYGAEMGLFGACDTIDEDGFNVTESGGYGLSESISEGGSESSGGSESFGHSNSTSIGRSYVPTYVPVYEEDYTRHYSAADQLQRRADRISRLGKGQAVVQLNGLHSQFVQFYLPDEPSSAPYAASALRLMIGQSMINRGVAAKLADAEVELKNRRDSFLGGLARAVNMSDNETEFRE